MLSNRLGYRRLPDSGSHQRRRHNRRFPRAATGSKGPLSPSEKSVSPPSRKTNRSQAAGASSEPSASRWSEVSPTNQTMMSSDDKEQPSQQVSQRFAFIFANYSVEL